MSDTPELLSKSNAPVGGRYLVRENNYGSPPFEVTVLEWSEEGRVKLKYTGGNVGWREISNFTSHMPLFVERLSDTNHHVPEDVDIESHSNQSPEPATVKSELSLSDDLLIIYMRDRFLSWPLPLDFSPDGGISFNPVVGEGFWAQTIRPTGTNLFDASQTEVMIRYMLDGLG